VQSHGDATGRRRAPERKTTLAAIAAAAGVSAPTVSKVVNGRPDVAPGTRARVEHLLAEHGYARPVPLSPSRVELSTELIVRESTAPPARTVS
jgi:DNA-binding LacI/PurR family transcriptional regulator